MKKSSYDLSKQMNTMNSILPSFRKSSLESNILLVLWIASTLKRKNACSSLYAKMTHNIETLLPHFSENFIIFLAKVVVDLNILKRGWHLCKKLDFTQVSRAL